MSSETTVTDASAFQQRSLGKQVLFFIVTLGLYGLYWWYTTLNQLNDGTSAEFNPMMRLLGLLAGVTVILIPVSLYVLWKTCNDAEAVSSQSGVVLFIVFLFISPLGWYWVQSGINEVAAGA